MMVWALLLLAGAKARAQDAHGAIAFGEVEQGDAVAYGLAWDYPSRDDAQAAAVEECISGGGSGCTVLAWFQNGCGALAVDQYGMAQGKSARSLDRAEARAQQACEAAGGVGCAVAVSQCVSQGEPDTWAGSESVLVAAPQEDVWTADGPVCAESAGLRWSDRCWEEIASQPGCFVWTDYRDHARVEAWVGECSGGTAHGAGVLSYVSVSSGDISSIHMGSFIHGKRHGQWVERYATGMVMEGPYVDGKQHGRWVIQFDDGDRQEGTIVDDEWQGHWVFRSADGSVEEGPMVDSKPHGHWVERYVDGDVREGPYVEGERHGHWVTRFASGAVLEYEYRNGVRDGQLGVYQMSSGERYPGRWSGYCFRGDDGRLLAWQGSKASCE